MHWGSVGPPQREQSGNGRKQGPEMPWKWMCDNPFNSETEWGVPDRMLETPMTHGTHAASMHRNVPAWNLARATSPLTSPAGDSTYGGKRSTALGAEPTRGRSRNSEQGLGQKTTTQLPLFEQWSKWKTFPKGSGLTRGRLLKNCFLRRRKSCVSLVSNQKSHISDPVALKKPSIENVMQKICKKQKQKYKLTESHNCWPNRARERGRGKRLDGFAFVAQRLALQEQALHKGGHDGDAAAHVHHEPAAGDGERPELTS